jgi:adenylylsulfate kinase
MSWVIWITGLPGSGKTTLAAAVAEALEARGIRVRHLDVAEVENALLGGPARSELERELVHRALAYTAKSLSESGVPVVVDATASRRSWREMARAMIPHFAEVQLLCPPDVCGDRERMVRWRRQAPTPPRAGSGLASPEPEIVLSYEYSLHPDLTLHTDARDVWGTVNELLGLALRLDRVAVRSLEAERKAP